MMTYIGVDKMKKTYWEENEADFNEFFNESYDKEMKEINEQLDKDILFVLIGNINSGKSSTINALMDEGVARVSSKPGETIEVEPHKYGEKVVFVDTPGLDDIIEDNSEMTLNYYKRSDIILFFLNAAGNVLSLTEKKVFEKIKKHNDNIIIVLNKIDAAEDIPALVSYIAGELGESHKIVPISSKTGENIDKLKMEILDILKVKKKDILFAKHVKEKSSIAQKWILGASAAAGAVGLTPIPGADIVPITAIQIGLMVKLSNLYDNPISRDDAKEMILTTITGSAGRAAYRQLIKLIPGYNLIVGGGVASSVTFALGQAIKYAYENQIELNPESLKTIYSQWTKKLKDREGKES